MSRIQEAFIPGWCAELEKELEAMADELTREARGWNGPETVFTPEEFGMVPGEKATSAIQRAVDAAAENGGIVRLERGKYWAVRTLRTIRSTARNG